ncbi:MAG: pyruvate kinase [Deltaproteobacteria bacterium]|nr:pyruvate kinase [Deltaproteobacteria bacterium]
MAKAKIICTIGPACDSEKLVTTLIKAGMSVARLNFSHGTHDEHLKRIRLIRRLSAKLAIPVAILQDLQGPKIRIGTFADPPIILNPGDRFTITTKRIQGNEHCVSTSYEHLATDVAIGDQILVNDGLIKLQVTEKTATDVLCEVVNGGSLYDRRGINLPGVHISEPSLTAKDKEDLHFGLANGVDYVALSFVRDAESIRQLKQLIGSAKIPVIAKLEKPEALENLEEIIHAADGVMVARGDLGVEIPASRVPVVQKEIIEKCLLAGKPVITATQMLDSMIVNPIPTRAETSDVANAIFDGSDAVMLSGETAFGNYPLQSVAMMQAIIKEAEKRDRYFRLNPVESRSFAIREFSQSICHSAYYAAAEINARYIVVFTKSGQTAKVMSSFRPAVKILALTPSEQTMRALALYWGITPVLLDTSYNIAGDLTPLEEFLKENRWLKGGENIVVIAGSTPREGGTNMLRLHSLQSP